MMRHTLGISVLLIAAFGAPAATASVVTYTIDFTGAGAPTAGSFTYDTDIPASPVFTAFSVTWHNLTFDLTSSANSPSTNPTYPACVTGSGAAASFGLLTGGCFPTPPGVTTQWYGQAPISPGEAYFTFITTVNSTGKWFQVAGFASFPSGTAETDAGVWTAPVSVPEPGSFIIMATAICAILARKRIAQGLRQATRNR